MGDSLEEASMDEEAWSAWLSIEREVGQDLDREGGVTAFLLMQRGEQQHILKYQMLRSVEEQGKLFLPFPPLSLSLQQSWSSVGVPRDEIPPPTPQEFTSEAVTTATAVFIKAPAAAPVLAQCRTPIATGTEGREPGDSGSSGIVESSQRSCMGSDQSRERRKRGPEAHSGSTSAANPGKGVYEMGAVKVEAYLVACPVVSALPAPPVTAEKRAGVQGGGCTQCYEGGHNKWQEESPPHSVVLGVDGRTKDIVSELQVCVVIAEERKKEGGCTRGWTSERDISFALLRLTRIVQGGCQDLPYDGGGPLPAFQHSLLSSPVNN